MTQYNIVKIEDLLQTLHVRSFSPLPMMGWR